MDRIPGIFHKREEGFPKAEMLDRNLNFEVPKNNGSPERDLVYIKRMFQDKALKVKPRGKKL